MGAVNYPIFQVTSETTLRLATPYTGATLAGQSYQIRRQFGTLAAWETCVDGNPCAFFPVASASLVADDRSEVGIAYKDSVLARVTISGSTTDATHTITLTADPGNRHLGVAGAGVVVDNVATAVAVVLVDDDYVTVEWLELKRGLDEGIEFQNLTAVNNKGVARNLIVHDVPKDGILIDDAGANVDVFNNIVYNVARHRWHPRGHGADHGRRANHEQYGLQLHGRPAILARRSHPHRHPAEQHREHGRGRQLQRPEPHHVKQPQPRRRPQRDDVQPGGGRDQQRQCLEPELRVRDPDGGEPAHHRGQRGPERGHGSEQRT